MRTASPKKHSGGSSRCLLQEFPAIAHRISPVRNGGSRCVQIEKRDLIPRFLIFSFGLSDNISSGACDCKTQFGFSIAEFWCAELDRNSITCAYERKTDCGNSRALRESAMARCGFREFAVPCRA